jgi:hypothetical protein
LSLLRHPSDEHKLAALLLLARDDTTDHSDASDASPDNSFLRLAFSALGDRFLVRLLRTPGAPQPDVPAVSFERVALRAAALFCTAPHLADHLDLSLLAAELLLWIERATLNLSTTTKDADSLFDSDVAAVVDSLAGLVAGDGPAFAHMLSDNRLLTLLPAFARALMSRAEPLQSRVAASRPRHDDDDDDDDDNDHNDKTDDAQTSSASAAPRPVDFNTLMQQGAKVRLVDGDAAAADDDDVVVDDDAPVSGATPKPFEKSPHAIPPAAKPARVHSVICSLLDITMAALVRAAALGDNVSESSAESVADCFAFVFAISQREEKWHAMELLLRLVPTLNPDRVAKSITLPAAVRRGLFDLLSSRLDDELRECALLLCALMTDVCGGAFLYRRGDDDKLVDLVMGLCAVEVRLVVEYAQWRLPAASALLGACYMLLERSVTFLTDEAGDWPTMSAAAIGHIESALRDVVRVLLLSLANDEIAPHVTRGAVGAATARFLGSWLAEDAESIMPALIDAVPSLWAFADVCEDGPGAPSALVYFLPALQVLTSDTDGTAAVLASDGARHLVQCMLTCIASLSRWYETGGVASELEAHEFAHITPPGLFVTCAGVVVNLLILHLPSLDAEPARRALLDWFEPLLAPLQALLQCLFHTAANPMPEETLHVAAFAFCTALVLHRETRPAGSEPMSLLRDGCQFVASAAAQRDVLGEAWVLTVETLCSALEPHVATVRGACVATGVCEVLAREITSNADDPARKAHARLLQLLSGGGRRQE